jgi:hypothetical protein
MLYSKSVATPSRQLDFNRYVTRDHVVLSDVHVTACFPYSLEVCLLYSSALFE